MKKIKYIFLSLVSLTFFTGCFEDQDDVVGTASKAEIGNFIWRAMNDYYLYKADVPDLADDRFATDSEREAHINGFTSPETFFESLVYNRATVDKFSWIVSDYPALEAAFAGVSKRNGMVFGFFPDPNNAINKAYGYVRYVLPNSDAATKGITRGVVFNTVNGTDITYDQATNTINSAIINNLNQDNYTIGIATFNGTTVTPTNNTVDLTKSVITENPIHKTSTLTVGSHKIGYLMYNSFTGNFDDALNSAFGTFKADGITDLVLDLRYNGGGSVLSAVSLSSMVTGQFNGQTFTTEQWNAKWQNIFQANNPGILVNKFRNTTRTGQALNSLNLNRIYVLTTGRSASASELIINGLNPYINVIQIGSRTSGKFQASITLYDSNNLISKQGVNLNHKYAIQPLVLKSLNSAGFTDYSNGFTPSASLQLNEDYSNLGVLGNINEPLLAKAIAHITGAPMPPPSHMPLLSLPIDFSEKGTFEGMYVEK